MLSNYQIIKVKTLVLVHNVSTYHIYEDKISKKNAMFKKLPFCQESILGTKILNANVQCVYRLFRKYQMPTSNALIQVE